MDSSALVASPLWEPEGDRFSAAILSASEPKMSAANWLEASMVFGGRSGEPLLFKGSVFPRTVVVSASH